MKNRKARVRQGVLDNEPVVFVPLTQGYTAIVDADAWPRIVARYGKHWHAEPNNRNPKLVYAWKNVNRGSDGRAKPSLQRAVMNAAPGERVEFVNDNRLDCRRSNLRKRSPEDAAQIRQKFAKRPTRPEVAA
jgi:hypothetical protein